MLHTNLDDWSVDSVNAVDSFTSAMFRQDLLKVVQMAVTCAPAEVSNATSTDSSSPTSSSAMCMSSNCAIPTECERTVMGSECIETLDPFHELVTSGPCLDSPTEDYNITTSPALSRGSSNASHTVEVSYDGAKETIVSDAVGDHSSIVEVKEQSHQASTVQLQRPLLDYRNRLPPRPAKTPASFYNQGSILENGPSARRLRKLRQLSRRSMVSL